MAAKQDKIKQISTSRKSYRLLSITLPEPPIVPISKHKLLVSVRRESLEQRKNVPRLSEKFMQNIKCYSTFSSNYDVSNGPHEARTFKHKLPFLFRNKKNKKKI